MHAGKLLMLFNVLHANISPKHEGREVKEGEKWVIRTDLCVRKEKSRFEE
jgi:hypothetical protein